MIKTTQEEDNRNMVVYMCMKCQFCFERSGEVDLCPDCGAMNVRETTDKEAAEYRRNQAEINAQGQ